MREELERYLSAKLSMSLSKSREDTLLGFLDVEQDFQSHILQSLRHCPNPVTDQLRIWPYTTTYALSVAAAVGFLVNDEIGHSAIYGAWMESFGWQPANEYEKNQVSNLFNTAVEQIGLKSGTIYQDQPLGFRGGCYLFHGAILPHFVEPLRVALKSLSEDTPLPDEHASAESIAFACKLSEKIPDAQGRLKLTLRSKVGVFLVRRLIRWHITGDSTLFPSHIRPLLNQQAGHTALLRSPLITINEHQERLELFLPAQSSKVAAQDTRWRINNRSYGARHDRAIPVSDIAEDGRLDVSLLSLAGQYKDANYSFEAGIPSDKGFRLFDAITGKEKKLSSTIEHLIFLPANRSYFILLESTTEIECDCEIATFGEWRILRYETLPESQTVKVFYRDTTWTFKPKVDSGLYLLKDTAQSFQATCKHKNKPLIVYYSTNFGLSAAIRGGRNWCICFSGHINVDSVTHPLFANDAEDEDLHILNVSEHFNNYLINLPPGVHLLTIKIFSEAPLRAVTHELFYWKGLSRLSVFGDVICEALPRNLRDHPGFIKDGNTLKRRRTFGDGAALRFDPFGEWEIPSNRVKVTLISSDGSSEEINEGGCVDILDDDTRLVQLQTGGLLPVIVVRGDRQIGSLSVDRPILSFYLSALRTSQGGAGVIEAVPSYESLGAARWPILKWRTPRTALNCTLVPSHATQAVWLARKICLSGVGGLRIKIADIEMRLNQIEHETTHDLALTEEDDALPVNLGHGLTCSLESLPDNKANVRFELDRTHQVGMVRVVDIESRSENSNIWSPLLCMEENGRFSTLRIIFQGIENSEQEPNVFKGLFWGPPGAVIQQQQDETALDHLLEAARWLIGCKYPSAVWAFNRSRLQSLYPRISSLENVASLPWRNVWWKHAVEEYQSHALELQPVLMPSLLLWSNLQVMSSSVSGCDSLFNLNPGLIASPFSESALYENRVCNGALDYVSAAFQSSRVDQTLLSRFSGFPSLINGCNVNLGRLNFIEWCRYIEGRCANIFALEDNETFPLLSFEHLVKCIPRLLRRVESLKSISARQHQHWLSPHIAGVRLSFEPALTSITHLLNANASSLPPISTSLLDNFEDAELARSLSACAILIAVLVNSKKFNLITDETFSMHMRSIDRGRPQNQSVEIWIKSQTDLVLGAAPELFSFYYLLFTLTLAPRYEP